MKKPSSLSTNVLALVVLCIMFLIVRTGIPAQAQEPTDGRINKLPWVNSFGAVAVYCVNQYDRAAGSFAGGGIKVLSSTGQRLFFASEADLNAASLKASQQNVSVVAHTESVYTLVARPGGYFILNSQPDAEGKTFLGEWQNCAGVGSEGTAVPNVSACVPYFIRNEADSGQKCGNCYNSIDDDCDGKTDRADFSCRYYCSGSR